MRDFVEEAFRYVGIEIEWRGENEDTKGVVASTSCEYSHIKRGDVLVEIDPRYFRPNEVASLIADYSKAKELLQWEPQIKFKELVQIMMDADLDDVGVLGPNKSKSILQKNNFDWIRGR